MSLAASFGVCDRKRRGSVAPYPTIVAIKYGKIPRGDRELIFTNRTYMHSNVDEQLPEQPDDRGRFRASFQVREFPPGTMKPPRILPMLSTVVQTGLVAVDNVRFGELGACPVCQGPVSGYDTKKKVFAIIREEDEERTIRVSVKRFFCRSCDHIINADEPFYPGTRIGSPVIDLCLSLATTMPVNRTATYLDAMGVVVDRTSCRLYVREHARAIPMTDLFGIKIPMSVVSLSALTARAGQHSPVSGAEVLAACGFPSADRAALHLPLPAHQRQERDAEEEKKERHL